MRAALAILITLGLLGVAPAQRRPRSHSTNPSQLRPRDIAAKALGSLVVVEAYDAAGELGWFGSGFVVAPGQVVTNWHVIKGAASLSVRPSGTKTELVATVYKSGASVDLAILRVPGLKLPELRLEANTEPAIGDTIYAVGNPEGFEGTFTQGIVSGRRQLRGGYRMQISAAISHGSSGGPVLDELGRVVGVAVSMSREGQSLNFALPSSLVVDLISSTPDSERGAAERYLYSESDELE